MKIECDYKIFVFYEDGHNEIACIFWFVNLGKVKMNFLFDFFFSFFFFFGVSQYEIA